MRARAEGGRPRLAPGLSNSVLGLVLALLGGCGGGAQAVAPPATTPGPSAAAPPTPAGIARSSDPSAAPPAPSPPAATAKSSGAAARPHASGSQTASARRPPPAHPVPASFRVAAGAPSDAEVRRELTQMYRVGLRLRRQQLSAEAANLAGLLPWDMEVKTGRVSVASVFRAYGLGLACGGVLGRAQLGVAHKTAPCGTVIQFSYAGRALRVAVIDRGPYIAGREWDLTGATADALGFPGLGAIAWSVVTG